MDSCKDYADRLAEIAAGYKDCGAEEQKHLSECASCRLMLEELQHLMLILKNEEIPAPSEQFDKKLADNVYASLKNKQSGARIIPISSRRRFEWVKAAAVAAVLLIALIAFFPGSRIQPLKPESATAIEPEQILIATFSDTSLEKAGSLSTETKPETATGKQIFNDDSNWKELFVDNTGMEQEDLQWMEKHFEQTSSGTASDPFSMVDSLSEEEAREILNQINEEGGQTSLPHGAS